MNHHYADVREKLGEPQWWDEHAVPRYCEFSPDVTADIYCREVCLLGIECQACEKRFKVCISAGDFGFGVKGFEDRRGSLAKSIEDGSIHYGDPPNSGCCPSGPTMNSVPRRVLQFWRRGGRFEWVRVPGLERSIECEWADA